MDRRFTRTQIHLRADGDKPGGLKGYGAVYYDGTPETEYWLWDDYVERILPGAFDRAIREDDVRGLFNHDPNMILGRTAAGTMRLSVDAKGLAYDIDLADRNNDRDVAESVRRGDVTGSSFSFMVEEAELTIIQEGDKETWIRSIKSVKPLFDVGPVVFPAYTGTTAGTRTLNIRSSAQDAADAIRARDVHREKLAAALAAKLTQVRTRTRVCEVESGCAQPQSKY